MSAEIAIELLHGPRQCDPLDLESAAERLHVEARSDEVSRLTGHEGVIVREVSDLPDGCAGLLLDDCKPPRMLIRRTRDPARMRLAILHELAHWLLLRSGAVHTHADVWYLTLALAIPRDALPFLPLTRGGPDASCAVPLWAIDLRRLVACQPSNEVNGQVLEGLVRGV